MLVRKGIGIIDWEIVSKYPKSVIEKLGHIQIMSN
jgi:hypothetical protein